MGPAARVLAGPPADSVPSVLRTIEAADTILGSEDPLEGGLPSRHEVHPLIV